jgi:DNA-binding MarR family transcriptional regulator
MAGTPDVELLLRELGQLIRQLTRLVGGADDGPPMTATHRIALVVLGDEVPLRLNDLARRMGTSTPTASRSVDTLEALGLVTRAPESSDRRALSIDVSARGRDLLDDRLRRAAEAFEPAAATLTAADRRELLTLLRRMTDALRGARPS